MVKKKTVKIEEYSPRAVVTHLLGKLKRDWDVESKGWVIYVWSSESTFFYSLFKSLGHRPRFVKNKKTNLIAIKIDEPEDY